MAANPDLKSGFQTDPDIIKNWDPDFGFKIPIKTRFRILNPDFKSRFNPDFRLTSGFDKKHN
jgi:hypothetical protein